MTGDRLPAVPFFIASGCRVGATAAPRSRNHVFIPSFAGIPKGGLLPYPCRHVKLLRFIASLLLVLGVTAGAAAAAQRPNILFVFIDDSGWGDLSCYGNPVLTKQGEPITPNLDRLASQGIRFTQGYVAFPICSPSRTAVLTGIEPARYAIYSFLDNKANNAARNMADWVQPDTVTAPRLFKQAGYVTGQFGKWHMGNGRDVNNAPPPSDLWVRRIPRGL